ncbi:hypothetical protein GCM10010269_15630 [Streptomyces humidus]|uniref:Uncharacterized protein n=1 Tax=Streptomyces humidus TaxID=52259 RepID=A0A918FTU1_9ACTN|nr:hypothetical protein [Streptomyces humidus]GGR77240.1 hypothetical protein GCM10010269_15630 [Streptomyces humidus]
MSITTTTSAKPTILFREACLPDVPRRSAITVPPPLRAGAEQLRGLPPAFVIVDEADGPRTRARRTLRGQASRTSP